MELGQLILLGIVFYSAVVFFQLVNLPVEFDAMELAWSLLDAYTQFTQSTSMLARCLGVRVGHASSNEKEVVVANIWLTFGRRSVPFKTTISGEEDSRCRISLIPKTWRT